MYYSRETMTFLEKKNVLSMGITATDAMLGKADALYFSVLMELYLTVTLLWPPDVKS